VRHLDPVAAARTRHVTRGTALRDHSFEALLDRAGEQRGTVVERGRHDDAGRDLDGVLEQPAPLVVGAVHHVDVAEPQDVEDKEGDRPEHRLAGIALDPRGQQPERGTPSGVEQDYLAVEHRPGRKRRRDGRRDLREAAADVVPGAAGEPETAVRRGRQGTHAVPLHLERPRRVVRKWEVTGGGQHR
jgi:hypothetical protein